jgi:peptidoglycan/LPS O-acetylase OafA/YrhL
MALAVNAERPAVPISMESTPAPTATGAGQRPRARGAHSPALDGLRWFSFLAVFLFHASERVFPPGNYGVQVFFVLSGFLIGNILLSLRENLTVSLAGNLQIFYIRRSLRIFPLYYFVLIAIGILGLAGVIDPRFHALPYHFLYLSNFYMVLTGASLNSQTHLWSLCVEEHFYLIAPLVLIRARIQSLGTVFFWLLLLITLARIANELLWSNPRFEYLSPMQFDVLICGIVAAMVARGYSIFGLNEARLLQLARCCAVPAMLILASSYFPGRVEQFAEHVLLPPLLGISVAGLILALWMGALPRLGRLLSYGPFVYLGSISYGLYLYHNFFFVVARHSEGPRHVMALALALAITIVVASVSWYALERPLLRLKDRFEYGRTARA